MKGMSVRAIIIAIILVLVGGFGIIKTSVRVLETAYDLSIINGEIENYNRDHTKSDSETAKARELFAERTEKFYESDDSLVRNFSKANILFKAVFVILSLASFIVVPVTTFKFVLQAIRYIYWGKKNQH